MSKYVWTIALKDIQKTRNNMEECYEKELLDLKKIYEEDIAKWKATEQQYLFYLNNYMKPYCEANTKRLELEKKLEDLVEKLEGDDE